MSFNFAYAHLEILLNSILQKASEGQTQVVKNADDPFPIRSASLLTPGQSLFNFHRILSNQIENTYNQEECMQTLEGMNNCMTLNLNSCQISCAGAIPQTTVFDDCNDFKTVFGSFGECCPSCATISTEATICVCDALEQIQSSHATTWTFSPGILIFGILFTRILNEFAM